MTKEQHRQYAREYRAEGFGAVNDKAYYERHRETILAKAREAYRQKVLHKLSQETE